MEIENKIDVVVVSYNSASTLRDVVEPLSKTATVRVFVVDNASTDGCLDTIADLKVERVANPRNGGFSYGCNTGWRRGDAPHVLFLNPDAAIDSSSLRRLASVLDEDPGTGIAAPRINGPDDELEYSVRRFPRLRSTFAQALFIHRVLPTASWVDETVRDSGAYEQLATAEWVSGACMLVRREVLEALDGLDEEFFLYGEDKDLCRRVWDLGYEVKFVPDATAAHQGGASAPRTGLLPVLTASRLRYARKHRGCVGATLERCGVALSELTHSVVGRPASRRGHLRGLAVALGLTTPRQPAS